VIAINMTIAAGPDKIANFKVALLCHHMGQQRVTRDIEGHP
jgi:hypothetical protein